MKKRTCVSTDSWLLVVSWVFFLHFELSYVIYVEFREVSESVS